MRTYTTTHTVYTYDELSDTAKQVAIEEHRQFLAEVMDMDYITEDAKTIGLNITEWDLYHNSIDGNLTEDLPEVVKLIKANHGDKTATYLLAEQYKNKHGEDAEHEFAQALLREYRSMLQKEWEYQLEDAQIIESITINEYEFTEDGKIA